MIAFGLGTVLFFSAVLMLGAAKGDSAIMDELAHIPAGYGYVRFLDYRLNPEHPPLVKTLAALPLLFMNLNFPTEDATWTEAVNGQWDIGTKFFYESGNDADQIVFWSRLFPILLTLLLIVIVYIWSKELLGPLWAFLPTVLTAFSPTVLAHGHYVTTDIGAALGVTGATYFFLKFLKNPSRRNLFWAGIAFGIAQALKFSVVLLIPFFAFIVFLNYFLSVKKDWFATVSGERFGSFAVRGWRHLRALFAIFIIGYLLIVYPLYALFTVNYPRDKQTSDTVFILNSFAGGPPAPGAICRPTRCLAEANIWMTKNDITRPLAEYILGVLMVMQRSSGGNTNYFLGEVSAEGSRLYFPITYLLKEPLPVLLLILIALSTAISRFLGSWRRPDTKAEDFSPSYLEKPALIIFVIFYWTYSIKSPLNIGVRHLLPTLPFIYMLTAAALKSWVWGTPFSGSFFGTLIAKARSLPQAMIKGFTILALTLWFLAAVLLTYPFYLSYFNDLFGGTARGYRQVTDSNYDWGQDLLRLREWLDENPQVKKIAVDYFGGGNVKYHLGERGENWNSRRGDPRAAGIEWLAVSVNSLQGAIQPVKPGFERQPEDEYRWLTSARAKPPGAGAVPEPDERAGTSIFIYKL